MTIWSDVTEFSEAAGVRIQSVPGPIPDDELDLAVRLVREEMGELWTAVTERDLIETADGIADSLYVLAGLLLRLGLARTYVVDIIRDAPTHAIHGYVDGWDAEEISAARDEIEIAEARILNAINYHNLIELDVAAHQAMYSVAGLGLLLGLPMQAVFQNVHASNMSKLVGGKVIRDAGGKIQKPPTFTRPDIAGVLAAHGWSEAA